MFGTGNSLLGRLLVYGSVVLCLLTGHFLPTQSLCQSAYSVDLAEKNVGIVLAKVHNEALETLEADGFWKLEAGPAEEVEAAIARNYPILAGWVQTELSSVPTSDFIRSITENGAGYEGLELRQNIYRALRLNETATGYCEALWDENSSTDWETILQDIQNDTRLSDDQRRVPQAVWNLALASRDYWQGWAERNPTDTSGKKEKIRVPFKRWAKADAFGLMKGFIGGAILYGGAVYLKSPEASGLAAGLWVFFTVPAIESVNYVRKFRRNEIEDLTPDEKDWEIDPNKL